MPKRGQATLFIAAGIIILIMVVLFFYYREAIVMSKWEKERAESMIVPEEAKELHDYVYSCIQEVTDQAIILTGLQGGYINLPEDDFVKGPANLFSTSLAVFPEADLRTAYWFMETPNKIQRSMIPAVNSMEEGISNYINTHLKDCTKNFEGFEVYKINEGAVLTETEIKDKAVFLTISYPLDFKRDSFAYSFSKFYYSSNSELGRLYNIAKSILETENNNFFFEDLTIDTLVLYDEIPYSETGFDCKSEVWTKSKVKDTLKDVLQKNIQFVKLKGSDFVPKNRATDYYLLDTGRSYRDVKVSFKYSKQWPLEMEVYPSKGEILKGDEVTNEEKNPAVAFLRSLFCLTNYHFVYDIKYPMLVTLQDKNDYIFQFATQVIINNNQPKENRLGTENFEGVEPELCQKGMSNIRVHGFSKNLDGNLVALEDADIKFKCITTTCEMGKTKNQDGEVFLEAKFPQCINGLLTADKGGYHTGKTFISTNEEGDVSVLLDKIYQKPFEVKIVEKGAVRSPLTNEQIIFEISEPEKDFFATILWPSEQKKISLIAGKYDVKTYVIEDSPFDIVIPAKDIESCPEPPLSVFGIFGQKKCEKLQVPSTVLDQAIKGGGSFKWELKEEDLAAGAKIIFYSSAEKVPASYDELADIYEKIEDNRDLKKPDIVI